jgi:hypothetical protein
MIPIRPPPQSGFGHTAIPDWRANEDRPMKLADLPRGTIDWSLLSPATEPGETGAAASRTRQFGDTRMRLVEYGAGYLADHWCDKGHVLFVVAGELVIEHRDGELCRLRPGMTWHVADATGAPHRVMCEHGATVFIVD